MVGFGKERECDSGFAFCQRADVRADAVRKEATRKGALSEAVAVGERKGARSVRNGAGNRYAGSRIC